MNLSKIAKVLVFLILGIALVVSFWQNILVLCILLVIGAFIKHKVLPTKKAVVWFVISGILGALCESLIMLSGPWSYAEPNFLNFPIWLIFLWGYAGNLGISFYQGITEKS